MDMPFSLEISLGSQKAVRRILTRRLPGGFTLVEMLVVLTIIIALSALVVPAASSVVRGSSITYAVQSVSAQFTLARQTAIARNRTVELRLYKSFDPNNPGADAANSDAWRFRAFQLFQNAPDGTAAPLSKVERLPNQVIVDSGATLSTLVNDTTRTLQTGSTTSLPGVGTSYKYCSVRFRSDGSTDLDPTKQWFLTIHSLQDGDAMSKPPTNFVTLQIDPVQGGITIFRPL